MKETLSRGHGTHADLPRPIEPSVLLNTGQLLFDHMPRSVS